MRAELGAAGAFAVTGLLWLACLGWGEAVRRLARLRMRLDAGLVAAIGFAALAVLGGVLDRAAAISRAGLLALVVAGVALAALRRAGREPVGATFRNGWKDLASRPLLLGAALAGGLWAFAPLAVNVGTRWGALFNADDDFHGYLLFPLKMLEAGSLGHDPFNLRRLVNGLGGQSFWQAIVLAWLPLERLHTLEYGLGLALLVGLVAGHARERGLSPGSALAALLFAVHFTWPIVNTTSVITGAALFYALVRWLGETARLDRWPERPSFGSSMLVGGFLCAGLASLKTGHLAGLGGIVGIVTLTAPRGARGRALADAARLAASTFVLLGPWMVGLRASSGSFLFPLLGYGHGSPAAIGGGQRSLWEVASGLAQLASMPIVLTCVGLALGGALRSWWRELPAGRVYCGALLGVPVAAIATWLPSTLNAPRDVGRYLFSYAAACLTVAMVELLEPEGRATPPGGAERTVAAALVMAFLVGAGWLAATNHVRNVWYMARTARAIDCGYHLAGARVAARALQAAVPPGQVVLAHHTLPFLFDQRRNPIWSVDEPWLVSPPPGMPVGEDAEALANYLRGVGARYLTFSYADRGGFPEADMANDPRFAPLRRFQERLRELARLYPPLADDGRAFVLDLGDVETRGRRTMHEIPSKGVSNWTDTPSHNSKSTYSTRQASSGTPIRAPVSSADSR